MAESNMVIKITTESDLSKANEELEELSRREQLILQDMKDLQAERNKAKGYAKDIKEMEKNQQFYNSAIETNVQRLKEVRKEQTNVKKSIEDLNKKLKELPADIPVKAVEKSFRTLKREIEDQLRTWDDWSAAGQAAYDELLAKAGEMDDQMKDTAAMIRYMGSDTQVFDTLVEGTQAVAGGFSIAQGAMALFGAENEDLQKMMVKLQSAIAISTGLQQVANVVQKESNLMMGIKVLQDKAAAKSEIYLRAQRISGTSATVGATIAQKAFNLAAKANPYVLLAVAIISVVGALALMTGDYGKAKEASDKYKSSIDGVGFATKEARDEHDEFLKSIRDVKVDIDVAKGKLTEYEAQILKLKNTISDSVEDRKKQTAIELEEIANEYDGFFKKLGKSFKKAMTTGGDSSFAYFAQERLEKEKEILEKETEDIGKILQKGEIDNELIVEKERVKIQEKRLAAQEKRDEEILSAENSLRDEQIKAMRDGENKEIAAINLTLERRLAAIKGNSQAEIDLRKQVEENTAIEIAKIKDVYRAKREKEDEAYRKTEIAQNKTFLNEYFQQERLEYKQQYERGEIDKETYEAKKRTITVQSLEQEIALREDYGEDIVDLELQLSEARIANAEAESNAIVAKKQEERDKIMAIAKELFNFTSELVNTLFDARKAKIEQEMADLQHFYTTDAEAARKNANLKLITEQEMAAKQLELKRKQAIADRQQAAFNIALTTAQAVMSALVSIPPNVPLSLVMAATGSVQLAAVLAKPLPKYAKGKKAGGQGHFATVGELGAETMWIPDGAAVIPHNRALDAQTFKEFNVPTFNIPEMPNVDSKRIRDTSKLQDIDYDKIGKAVADNVKIPSQKHVSVNVNRDGVTVDDGLQSTTYLNSKFKHKWN